LLKDGLEGDVVGRNRGVAEPSLLLINLIVAARKSEMIFFFFFFFAGGHEVSDELSAEQFEKPTKNGQLDRYITLVDGNIHFYQSPAPPHGEIISDFIQIFANQLGRPKAFFVMANHDSIHSRRNFYSWLQISGSISARLCVQMPPTTSADPTSQRHLLHG